MIAWSRILDDEEVLCVVNGHGTEPRGGDVVVDASLEAPSFEVVLNSAQAAGRGSPMPVGTRVPVLRRSDGTAYIELRDVGPSEVLALTNRP